MHRALTAVWGFILFVMFLGASRSPAQVTSSDIDTPRPTQTAKPATPAPSATSNSSSPNPWLELLKSKDPKVRAKAVREMGKQGDITTIPALTGALSDSSDKVRREAVIALAQMHQPPVIDGLVSATHDADSDVRGLAVRCLVGYYTGNVPTSGFTGFMKSSWQRAKGRFEEDTTKLDPGISVDPKVVSALQTLLKDVRSSQVAGEAAKGLGVLVAQAAVPDLVSSAHSSNADLAREALNALRKIKDRSAGPQLVDLLDSPNHDVRRDAMVTMGILRAEQAIPRLQQTYEAGTDEKDKESALQGLAYMGPKVSVPIFIKALWSNDKNLRVSAAEGLARAGDPKGLPELEKAVAAEKDRDARLAMEFALTALGKQNYQTDLITELGTRSRGDVAQSYLIELARNPQFLPRLYPSLQSDDETIRKRLCTVLMYSGDQSSIQELDRLAHDPKTDVAAESLRAKQAIRVRLAAGGTASASGRANP